MTPRRKILMSVEHIAANHGYTLSDILTPTRLERIVRVRDEVIYDIWQRNSLSLNQIGRIFNRHHSSIYTSIGRHMNRVGIEHEYAEAYRVKKAKQLDINRKAPALSDAA